MHFLPISVTPSLTPSLCLQYQLIFIPALLISLLTSDSIEGVMKNTPRKYIVTPKPSDEWRFLSYLLARCLCVCFGVFLQGWVTSISLFNNKQFTWYQLLSEGTFIIINTASELDSLRFVHLQNIISLQMTLQLVVQALTLIER